MRQNLRKRLLLTSQMRGLAVAFATLVQPLLMADISLYDNTSRGVDHYSDYLYGLNATSFTNDSETRTLTGVSLGLHSPGASTGTITVSLYSWNGSAGLGNAFQVLGTIQNSLLPSGDSLAAVSLSSNPLLLPNTSYWIVTSDSQAQASTVSLQYTYNDSGGTGVAGGFTILGGGTPVFNEWRAGIMQVTASAAVPEPGQGVMLAGMGLLGFATWRAGHLRRSSPPYPTNSD